MKEVLNFIVWQWNQWQTWQKGYIVGAFMLGASIFIPEPYSMYLVAVPMTMLFVWTFKWAVWNQIKASWDKYQTEKQGLFATIKESDK